MLKLLEDKLKVQWLRQVRVRFGASSEQLDDPQLALIADLPMHELAPLTQTPKAPAANSEGFDRSLPAHLPRENHVYRPQASDARHDAAGQACGCRACGGRLRQIGQDVSEQLEYVPSRFKVIRHVRPKLACMACESIFQAAAPSRPIARGVAGPGLLAHVLVAALGRYVLAGAKLHADDTPVAELSPGRGRTKTGRLWVYVRDDRASASAEAPVAWLRYSPDCKGEHPQAHLKDFKGVLQADTYAGFAKLYASGNVIEASCWAHARRPFWDLHESQGRVPGPVAEQALRRIGALYAIEADIRGRPPDERCQERQARAGPLLEELFAWLRGMLGQVSAKSELARAIGYTLTRLGSLTRCRDDGRIEIDSNAAERALRGVGLGRNHGIGRRRRARRGHLQPGGDGQAERDRP